MERREGEGLGCVWFELPTGPISIESAHIIRGLSHRLQTEITQNPQ